MYDKRPPANWRTALYPLEILNLFWEPLPNPHVLLPKRPHTHPPQLPAVRRLVRPIDEGVHVLVIEDGKPVRVPKEQPGNPDIDVFRYDLRRIIAAAGNLHQIRMEKIIIHRNVLAAGGAFLHIGGQREHLEFLIPGGIAPADPPEGLKTAVRHPHIEPLVWFIGPCVPKPHQLTDSAVIGAVPCIAAIKSGQGSRKPQRVGCTGIDTHPAPTDTHFNGVHGGVSPQVGIRRPADRLTVTAKKGGALVKLHPLCVIIQTAENIPAEHPCLPAAVCRERQPCPQVQFLESAVLPCKLPVPLKLGVRPVLVSLPPHLPLAGERRPVAFRQGVLIPKILVPDERRIRLPPQHLLRQLESFVRLRHVPVHILEFPRRKHISCGAGARFFRKRMADTQFV